MTDIKSMTVAMCVHGLHTAIDELEDNFGFISGYDRCEIEEAHARLAVLCTKIRHPKFEQN